MKSLFSISFILVTTISYSQSICDGKKVIPTQDINHCDTSWQLVFFDEFDGINLDTSLWEIKEGVIRDPEFEHHKGWIDKSNVEVSDGFLSINVNKQDPKEECFDIWVDNAMQSYCDVFTYTCGEIWTKEQYDYGKVEAMIKVPPNEGLWPAFWMFSSDYRYNEIDIFEIRFGKPKDHNMDVHYDPDFTGALSCQTDYCGPDLSKDFHKFTLIWTPTMIQWLVDDDVVRTDYKYYTLLGQGLPCRIEAWNNVIMNLNYPDEPMHVILNIAVANKENAPDENGTFPQTMEVDWVKIYKMEP